MDVVEGTYAAVVHADGAMLVVAYPPPLLRSELYGGVGEEDKSDEDELLAEDVRDSDEMFG